MKNFWSKIVLNVSLFTKILIYIILSLVAFFSLGFSDGAIMGDAIKSNSLYFWLAAVGLGLIALSLIVLFIFFFVKECTLKKVINFVILFFLTTAIALMLASQIKYYIDGKDTSIWTTIKLVGACLIIFIGYSITIKPQIELIKIQSALLKAKKLKEKEEEKESIDNVDDEETNSSVEFD